MKIRFHILILCTVFSSTSAILKGAQPPCYYVSPAGSDTNPGTQNKPFRTIDKARDAVRQLIATKIIDDVTVYLRDGKYFTDHTICFDERDSGRDGHKVSYKAYPDEKPVIYGGKPVVGWQHWKDSIYRVPVPKGIRFFRLFENGRSAVMARYPNAGSGYGAGLKRINNTTVKAPPHWEEYDFSDAQVYGWMGGNWFAELRKVNAYDRSTGLLSIDKGSQMFGGLNSRIFIQGVPELLDQEGEWCLKPQEGYLYYWPRCLKYDNEIDQQLIVIPTVKRILNIQGTTKESRVSHLTFEGITFIGSDFTDNWRIFTRAEGDGSMPESLREGLIYIENADNITIRFCKIIGAGHSAVYINQSSQNDTVYGCWIEDAGFCGVYMNGYVIGTGPFKSAAESYVNKGHTISNNFIYDCGKFIGGGCGVQFYQSGDNIITHNVIAQMPRYGISYKGQRFGVLPKQMYGTKVTFNNHYDFLHSRNNVIAYNDIFNVCRDSFDFGAIEAWGPGRDNVWCGNAIHDIEQAVNWDGWAHGLFTDDACHYHTLKNNIIYELKGGTATGAVMVKSGEQKVINNIIADNVIGRTLTMEPYFEPAFNMIVSNNIFFGETPTYATGKKSFKQWVAYPNGEKGFPAAFVKDLPVFKEVDHNLFWPKSSDMEKYHSFGWDKNSLTANPLFDKQNPQWDVTYRDYKLKKDSPALSHGFKQIDVDSIGLLDDFPFDRSLILLKPANETIQAENYNRIFNLRPQGETCIYNMKPGAWAKYENVDFGNGDLNSILIDAVYGSTQGALTPVFELRVDSPVGKLIGTVKYGDKTADVLPVRGRHNLFLVFKKSCRLSSIQFMIKE